MSHHSDIALFDTLTKSRGAVWRTRGYALVARGQTYSIDGDLEQFYLDAVAADADAHLALEFLRRHGSASWDEVSARAEEDGIDLIESQDVFLMGQSLETHAARL